MKRLVKAAIAIFDPLIKPSQRWLNRTTSLILLLSFSFGITLLSSAPSSSQVTFNDIQDHWAELCIQQLEQRKIVSGYYDRSFRPNVPVTRAEYAAIVTKAFPDAPIVQDKPQFNDIPQGYWAEFAINKGFQTAFLQGYPGNLFKPSQNISRLEVLLSLTAGLGYEVVNPVIPEVSTNQPQDATINPNIAVLNRNFDDASQIPLYAQSAIATATQQQLVVNYPQVRQLRPQEWANRGEVSALICQALDITGVLPAQYIVNDQQNIINQKRTQAPTPTPQATNLKQELRGVWLTNIDSDILFSRQKLTSAINKLAELNFNTIYPTVWNGGYTLYPSRVAQKNIGIPIDPSPGLKGRDLLKESITQAHRNKMAVIPWFEFGFMAPANSELAQQHPEWLTHRRDGDKIWLEGNNPELPRVWLNPLHPEVQDFIEDLVVEIVTNYDVDGIQFDDHFGFPADFGYDELTLSIYQQEHDGELPPEDSQDPQWIQWRADKITNYLQRLFKAIKQANPDAVVSVSPNPYEWSLTQYLADWKAWERQGLIEELIVQVYRSDLNAFKKELAQPELQQAKTHIPVAIGILSGLKPQPVAIALLEDQIKQVRKQKFAGFSCFFYESLWNLASEPPSQRQAFWQNILVNSLQRPNIYQGWTPAQ